jgi:5'-nucleotidase
MRILCDVDGVVADLHTEWLRRYNRDYGDTLTADQITGWEIDRFVSVACGKRIYDYLRDPDLYLCVDPVDGAQEGVAELRRRGHRVVFVTSNVKGMLDQKWAWLERNGFLPEGSTAADLVSATDKSFIMGQVAIDDYSENLRTSLAFHRLLFAQPWNVNAHSPHWSRVYNWPSVVEHVAMYERMEERLGA